MSWHAKKTYINGKVVHPRGGGILLDAKHIAEENPTKVKEIEHCDKHIAKGTGLSSIALKRLEALKPREIEIPKRQNIKF